MIVLGLLSPRAPGWLFSMGRQISGMGKNVPTAWSRDGAPGPRPQKPTTGCENNA